MQIISVAAVCATQKMSLTRETQKRNGAVTRSANRDHVPSRTDSSSNIATPLNTKTVVYCLERVRVDEISRIYSQIDMATPRPL